jgi:ATP-dependent Clp protease ATP-binding subunit ClpA
MPLSKNLDPTHTGRDAEKLCDDLHNKIVGQDEAINQIVNTYQMYLAGMNSPSRPIGNFLFLGPTGSGKTRLVEAVAESLVGETRAVIKIDCGEFQHSHEIAKLIGSPPGYLGHRETRALLSQEVLNQYHTERIKLGFVLFDEIEKASDALWNLLLGILDRATLTLGDNRRVDFSRTLIFMTSNLGAAEMGSILRPRLGFSDSEIERLHGDGQLDDGTTDKIARAGLAAARRKFTPEFMNRIDKVVVFKLLGQVELRKILELELGILQLRIFDSSTTTPFVFSLTEEAKDQLLREGTDMRYGARHLKRAIDRSLAQPMSNLIATGQVCRGDFVKVAFDPGTNHMTFIKEAENMPAIAMLQMMKASAPVPVRPVSVGAVGQIPGMAARGRH